MGCQHETTKSLCFVPCSKEYKPGSLVTGVAELRVCSECGALTAKVVREAKEPEAPPPEGWMVERSYHARRHYIVGGKSLCGITLSYVGELRPHSRFSFKTQEKCQSCWNLSRGH